MPEANCPECGKTLDSSGADCPACLLNLALETPSGDDEPTPQTTESAGHHLEPGSTVGPYTIVRELGEGGMGVVYLAEQTQPINRRVALKVIKRGMDTEQVVKRFEAERQALALMDHGSIARVYEAGETSLGRPYFAMEFIDGEPITDYCDRKKLSTTQRLALFTGTCEGVQHAHRRGIIHRDIKPSNVLVSEADGEPQPKIIDFGVAKATERSLTEDSAMTELGVLLGTPEYMSPEQAELTPFDVDTRTDVYSLGVLLYELLTGALPFDRRALRKAAFDEVRRQIREVRPSKPSTRISQLGERASGMASSRGVDVSSLSRRLAGDLDLITMKALEKERDQRYGSPAELADDIRRHLSDEPVLARPASVVYQLRKLAARNRLASGLATLVLTLLVVCAVVMALQNQRIRRERDRATREAQTAEEVAGFLQDLFEVPDPRIAKGDEISAREVLDWGAARIESELADQPEIQTRLMLVMGNVYNNLGVQDEAQRLLEFGIQQARDGIEQDASPVIEGLRVLAWVHRRAGHTDEALAVAQESLELGERFWPADDPRRVTLLINVGVMQRDRGDLEQAQLSLDRAVEFAERTQGTESAGLATALYHRAWLEHRLENHDAALQTYERACPMMENVLGELHSQVAWCFNDQSQVLAFARRHEEAAGYLQRATEIWERVLPSDHPYLADAADNMGTQYYWGRDYVNAEIHYRRALEMREALFDPDHPQVGSSLHNVGLALRKLGHWNEAEDYFVRGIRIAETAHGPGDDRVINELTSLADLYTGMRRFAQALQVHERILAAREKTKGPDHLWVAGALRSQAQSLMNLQRFKEAEPPLRRAVSIAESQTGWESQGHVLIVLDLGFCYLRQGRTSEAREVFERVRDGLEQADIQHLGRVRVYYELARLARSQGDTEQADAWIAKAVEVRPDLQSSNLFVSYVLAVSRANREDRDGALQALRNSLDLGMFVHIVDREDFATLRGDAGFEELLAEYR